MQLQITIAMTESVAVMIKFNFLVQLHYIQLNELLISIFTSLWSSYNYHLCVCALVTIHGKNWKICLIECHSPIFTYQFLLIVISCSYTCSSFTNIAPTKISPRMVAISVNLIMCYLNVDILVLCMSCNILNDALLNHSIQRYTVPLAFHSTT